MTGAIPLADEEFATVADGALVNGILTVASVLVIEADEGSATTPGARLVVHQDGRVEGTLGDQSMDERCTEEALRALRDGHSATVRIAGDVRAFIEVLAPATRLLVCGAGHDAIPLVRFASNLGLAVEVIDDREAFLKPTRFPEAARLVKA